MEILKMRILHITPNFSRDGIKSYVKFINNNFTESHEFVSFSKQENIPSDMKIYRNIKYENSEDFRKIIEGYDKVIFHSLFPIKSLHKIFLLTHPKQMKKIFWVAWGGDLYVDPCKKLSLRGGLSDIVAYLFKRNVKNFIGIFPPDCEYYKNKYNRNATIFYASYVGGLDNSLYKKSLRLISLEEKRNNNTCINIQVGHSSARILNHIEVLENLVKYKDENIKIYIPLSYGDEAYGNRVEEKAKLLFGNKAICMREMMNREDYQDFLSTMDIAIFNTPRQIGLGNIYPLLYMEKKIYLPAGSVMYDYYKSLEINVCDYKQLQKMEFTSFLEPKDMTNAKQYVVSNAINRDKYIEMWNKVFDSTLDEAKY